MPLGSSETWAKHIKSSNLSSYLWNRDKRGVQLNNVYLSRLTLCLLVSSAKFWFVTNYNNWLNIKSEGFPELQHMTAVSQPGDNTVIFESVRRHSALSRRLEGATDSEARSQGNRMLYNVLYQEERANQNAHVPSSRNTERHFRESHPRL